jgi:hypothetical protein
VPIRWGPWRLNEETLALELLHYGRLEPSYEVDLEHCRTSAEALDWIAQVTGKRWATVEIVGNLVRAMDELLKFQANLCGSGQDREFDDAATQVRSVAKLITETHENQPFRPQTAGEVLDAPLAPDHFRAEYD